MLERAYLNTSRWLASSILILGLGLLSPANASPLRESQLLAKRDTRYGRIDQVDSRLVDSGARLPLGDDSYAQCATTCFLNVLAKIRGVLKIPPRFATPYEEMSFLVNEFAPRFGISTDTDLRVDGITFTQARKLYKAYLDFLGVRNETSLFGL